MQKSKLRLVRLLIVMLLAVIDVHAFLSQWSLADGAPRNSLQLFLEGQAHRPFAYRVLAPAFVKSVDESMPVVTKNFLANDVAPIFRVRYVEPLLRIYESPMPGITERAHLQWAQEHYRSSYVLMVGVMFFSLVGAMLLLHRVASTLGAGESAATAAVVVYGLVLPTMFLNGGYFYDFTEQFGALAFICCILEKKWWLSALVLFFMQVNKETALFMPIFLLPHIWQFHRREGLRWISGQLLMCGFLLVAIRLYCAHLPGQSTEWHLRENLDFWLSMDSWRRTADFYATGLELPRFLFLLFALLALAWGLRREMTAIFIGATMALGVLALLLLTMGYTDEYRNLSLALPLLILCLFEKRHRKEKFHQESTLVSPAVPGRDGV